MRKCEKQRSSEVAMKKTLMKHIDDKGQSESDPPFWKVVQRFKIIKHAKKTCTT